MILKSWEKMLVELAVVNVCMLVCIFFLSCTGSSGDGGGSNENNFQIPASTIHLNSLSSWEGLEPFADDSIGDASDPEVDIERVFFSYDDDYFYVRINIVGTVDDDIDENLRAEISFIDDLSGYEIFFNLALNANKVDVVRIGNEVPPCISPQQMMSYPGNEFMELFEHAIVFKVRLSDMDFNFDGSRVTVRVLNKGTRFDPIENEDSTDVKKISMDTSYLSSVTSNWPEPSSLPPYTIPNAAISIDWDLTDWDGIDPVFIDRLDDVYPTMLSANIEKAFIAQDATAYYFRIDLSQEIILAQEDPNPQVRFEFADFENNRDYMFTAWLNPIEGGVWIQDLNLPVPNDSGRDTIKEYPPFFYLSVAGKSVEYRVMKSDMGFELKNGCISACAVIFGTDDYTDSVFLE